jgi:hypothetical protein
VLAESGWSWQEPVVEPVVTEMATSGTVTIEE